MVPLFPLRAGAPVNTFVTVSGMIERAKRKESKQALWKTRQGVLALARRQQREKRRAVRKANLAALKARQAFYDTGIRHDPAASLLDGAT